MQPTTQSKTEKKHSEVDEDVDDSPSKATLNSTVRLVYIIFFFIVCRLSITNIHLC